MMSVTVRLGSVFVSLILFACDPPCEGAACCGNGELDGDEACDDGRDNSSAWARQPHCNAVCSGQGPYCGDGELAPEEACDHGAQNSNGYSAAPHCNAACTALAPHCGDGNIDAGETCDDGAANQDGWAETPHCNASCSGQAPTCDLPEDTSVTFPRPGVTYPAENPHSREKMLLGKILFWEEQLSADDTVACGTCHRPAAGGADPRALTARHPGEDGVLGTADDPHGSPGIRRCTTGAGGAVNYTGSVPQVTARKAPSFLDAMLTSSLFVDGRAQSEFIDPDTLTVVIAAGGALESQAVGPPVSPVEMACEGRSWSHIHAKLQTATPLGLASNLPNDVANFVCKYPTYPQLFAATYGTPLINTRRIAFAIATYERTLLSDQTPYHRYVAGDTTALDATEQAGMTEFLSGTTGKCQRCHKPAQALAGDTFANLGFSTSTWDGGATGIGDFRTPNLMNVGLRESATGPLLHDGLAHGADLETIMESYNNPPNVTANTHAFMTPLGLSPTQLAQIVAFMRTGLTDPRVAAEQYPFDRPTLSTE